MNEGESWRGKHLTSLDLFEQEYALALSSLYSDPALTPKDRHHRAQELAREYRRRVAQEMEAVRAQREGEAGL
jgi:hypothetical protein